MLPMVVIWLVFDLAACFRHLLKTVRGGSMGDDYGDPPVAAAYFMLLLCV